MRKSESDEFIVAGSCVTICCADPTMQGTHGRLQLQGNSLISRSNHKIYQ